MKQLWYQFLFKPELLHHHIQIWILSRAWSPLPSRQSCICATLKQASGAQRPRSPAWEQHIQLLTFQQPFTRHSTTETHKTSSCTDTGKDKDADAACAFEWTIFLLMSSFRHVYYRWLCILESVYLPSPKLVCSADCDEVCLRNNCLCTLHVGCRECSCESIFMCMHVTCLHRRIPAHLRAPLCVHISLVWLGHLRLLLFACLCYPPLGWDLDLQHSRND